jgi:uncharacterized glyoxalase superfamily protein PhnB
MNTEAKQTIYPVLRYSDVRSAVAWLGRVFSLKRAMVVDGPDGEFLFATMTFGNSTIMLSSTPAEDLHLTTPKSLGASTAAVHVYVRDVDEHHKHAVARGAEIMRPLADTRHGTRDYCARDLEGHVWTFSTYQP